MRRSRSLAVAPLLTLSSTAIGEVGLTYPTVKAKVVSDEGR